MKKILLYASIAFFISKNSVAQHTDQVLNDEINTGALHSGLDEIDHSTGSVGAEKATMLKTVPHGKKNGYSYTFYKTENNRGLVKATAEGKTAFEAEYHRNKLHGKWVSMYQNGHLQDSGHFEKNIPDGQWNSWYANGNRRSIRSYSAEKWKSAHNKAARYNYKIQSNNELVRMAMKGDGSFERITSAEYSFGSMPVTTHGYTAPFKNCLHHGLYMNFHSNGAVKDSGYYKDGLRDGHWEEYFENGQLSASGSYLRGKKNSGWKYFDKKGKLVTLAEYREGRMMHQKKY